jgi:hypothetical protein
MGDSARDRMLTAIRAWMIELERYPGWREWQRKRFGYTLYFDDPLPMPFQEGPGDFVFSREIEKQHAALLGYLGLLTTIESLKQCEYYFRRYPFNGLPVSRHDHITNICEMYFGRFYEFRERLKKYLNSVTEVVSNGRFKVGPYIKAFDRVFDQELRARHSVHHHERFEDIAINRVYLTDVISTGRTDDGGWRREHLVAYRKLANEWAQRVQRRSQLMEEFLEAVAEATVSNCRFLSDLLAANLPTSPSVTSASVDVGSDSKGIGPQQDSQRLRH